MKTGFSVAVIVTIVALLQTTAAMDALLLFAAAGIVPGTDIKLTPNATMYTLISMAAISILAIFSGNLFRMVRSMRQTRRAKIVAAQVEAVASQVALTQALAVAPAAVEFQTAPVPVLAPAVVAPKAAKPKPIVIIKLPGSPGRIVRGMHLLRRAAIHTVAVSAQQIPVIQREAASRTRYAIGVAILYLAYTWRWAKPRLIKLERRINARLNQHQDITFVINFLRAVSKIMTKWRREGRAYAIASWRKVSRRIM